MNSLRSTASNVPAVPTVGTRSANASCCHNSAFRCPASALPRHNLRATIGRRDTRIAAAGDRMKNGLYSIHISLLDGNAGKGSGVIVFHNGVIRGGDAYLYYTGSYRLEKNDTFKGEVIVNRH